MDVRARAATFLKWSLVSLTLRVIGFAPRHLNRCAASCFYERRIFDKVVSVELWILI